MSEFHKSEANKHLRLLKIFLIISILEGLLAILVTLLIPPDPKNAFIFGFSLRRLAILAFLFLMLGGLSFLLTKSEKVRAWITNHFNSDQALFVITGVGIFSAIFLWITIWLPSVNLGAFESLFVRLKPLLIWFELICVQFFLFIKITTNSFAVLSTQFRQRKRLLGLILLLALGIWVFITTSKIGLVQDTPFWNVPGIPISPVQFITIILSIFLVLLLISRPNQSKVRPQSKILLILLPLAIYIVTVVVWGSTPMLKHYFSLEPTAPNFQPFPYSDARVHDLGALSILKGEGINFQGYTDKPLYMVFLAVLHLFSGDNYVILSWVQILVLALIPVFLYIFGKKFHSWLFGVVLAVLVVFQQRNAIILSYKIASVNPKLLVTEEITLLGIIIISYLLFLWMNNKTQNLILILGGLIGAFSLIRINPIFILPAIVVTGFFLFKKTPRIFLKQIGWLTLSFLFVFSPWLITGVDSSGSSWFLIKLMDVINSRYLPTTVPIGMNDLLIAANSKIAYASQEIWLLKPNAPNTLYKRTAPEVVITNNSTSMTETNGVGQIAFLIVNHFLHNFSTSLLALPDSIYIETTENISQREYWQDANHWNGNFPPIQYVLIIINLALFGVGLAESWKRYHMAGLVPLIVFIMYDLSLSFAMNSGSRYIVPINWIIFFYYAMGLIYLINVFLNLLNIKPMDKVIESDQIEKTIVSKPKHSLLFTYAVISFVAVIIPIANLVVPMVVKPALDRKINAEKSLVPEQKGNQLVYGQILYPYYTKHGTIITFDFLAEKAIKKFQVEAKYLKDKKIVWESDVDAVLNFVTIQDNQQIESIYFVNQNESDLIWQQVH